MFSSHRYLKRKTPAEGIDRREYIGHLVDEYYTSTNVEALEQVTANLANFAYDPINWPYLHEAEALEVFVTALDTQNPNLQLHAVAALCNFCLDEIAAKFIVAKIAILRNIFLSTEKADTVLHSLALHYQLLSAGLSSKEEIVTPALLKRVLHWRQSSNDERVVKLCIVFLEDFGSRTEITQLHNATAATSTTVQPATSQPKTGSSDKTVYTEGS
ncbi:armadillo repeat-containing protein 7 isoform X1 [Drosophila mojavensis]|uniref:armadillo repeat-containing protein 7 isoform X1 n=1 Tax=Drosophila mojavensis TaxID=7230 RepID=UPI00017C841D|nr:armadillo repeat-containing protein 7 isoform X1 [Drosophila mojavensis]